MHWIYSVYIFVCTTQLAIFTLFIALDLHIKSIQLVNLDPPILYPFTITPFLNVMVENQSNHHLSNYVFNNVSGAGPIAILVPMSVVLDMEIFACSILSVVFSILYIYISNLDYQRPELLHTGDAESLIDLVEPLAVRPLEIIRIVFWVFVLNQYFTIFSAINFYTTATEKYLYAIIKTVIVWLLCRTGNKKQTREMFAILSLLYVFILWIYSACFSHGTKLRESLIVLIIETVLDSLLVLGHFWDSNTPMSTVLNCRSFYVAVACTLVQSLVFYYDEKD